MIASGGASERERRPTAKILVCKDYARGRCSRSDCRFAHTSSTLGVEATDEGDVVSVCNDFLRSRCARSTSCRYFHPPPHLISSLASKVGITLPGDGADMQSQQSFLPVPAPAFPDVYGAPSAYLAAAYPPMAPASRLFTRPALEVCRDFLKGRCSRDASACRYAHTNPNAGDGNLVTVCQDFLKGRCERPTCRYYHPEEHLRARIKDVPVNRPGHGMEADPLGGAYQAAYSAYAVASMYENQAAAKRMRVEDGGAPGAGNSAALASLGGDDDRMPYYSALPPMYGSPAMHQLPMGGGYLPSPFYPGGPQHSRAPVSQDRLPVCRDFINGKCVRGACRYVHPDDHVQVVDGHVTLCRDAARNKCEREHCRFYHPPSSAKGSGGDDM
ncbi:hypothetical protein CLOM_g20479 [Closterium sp. NIES-68]|nr:hypothetical protein CLOM_g20479 [Closterium sp. NIES-68]GJP59626.1 hypothetical protein CLOP_g13270 [Closterium sp. NIES-67]